DQPRAEDRHPVCEQTDAPAERRPDEPRIPGGEEVHQREKRDHAEIAHQVGVEARLGGGAAPRAAQHLGLARLLLDLRAAVRLPVAAVPFFGLTQARASGRNEGEREAVAARAAPGVAAAAAELPFPGALGLAQAAGAVELSRPLAVPLLVPARSAR